jgi:hypothetical protein
MSENINVYFSVNWFYDRFVLVYIKNEKHYAFGTSVSREDLMQAFRERVEEAIEISLNNYVLLLEKMQKRRRAKLNGYLPKQEAQVVGKRQ